MADEAASYLFFLIAGEASGDLLGAKLMHALKVNLGEAVRFAGIGGPRMQEEGLDLFFSQSELAHFGVFELLNHIPHILKRIRQTVAEVKRLRPAALVTIDAPDFSFRVAKKLTGEDIPLIHYVAPTVWAWRPGRAQKVADILDHLLALFPFEPPYFTEEGLGCTFVGHPILESGADQGDAQRFRTKYGIGADVPLLAVLPGSRHSEIARLMPVFAATVGSLKTRHPALRVVIPAAPGLAAVINDKCRDWAAPVTITESDQDKYDAFAASRVALACSGTVALELAIARLPAVIAYKINPLTFAAFRRFIKVDYVNLVNIMHGKPVVPELLQEDCEPEKLANAVDDLFNNDEARQKQIAGLAEVADWLGQGKFIPSEQAAKTVMRVALGDAS
jgi:lipid-A-disaccharide synthase